MTRILAALVLAASVTVASVSAETVPAQTFTAPGIDASPTNTYNLNTCTLQVSGTGTWTIVPQGSNDTGLTYGTVTTIGGGSITSAGTYSGAVAGLAGTYFRFQVTAVSGSVSIVKTCTPQTLPSSGGSAASPGPTSSPGGVALSVPANASAQPYSATNPLPVTTPAPQTSAAPGYTRVEDGTTTNLLVVDSSGRLTTAPTGCGADTAFPGSVSTSGTSLGTPPSCAKGVELDVPPGATECHYIAQTALGSAGAALAVSHCYANSSGSTQPLPVQLNLANAQLVFVTFYSSGAGGTYFTGSPTFRWI